MGSGRYGPDFCFYIQIEGQLAACDRTGRETCVALSARPFAVRKRPDERGLRRLTSLRAAIQIRPSAFSAACTAGRSATLAR